MAALACAVSSTNYADLVVRTQAGAETIVPGGLELVEEATRQAFQFLEVRRTSYRVDSGSEARHMAGRVANRDGEVWVTLQTTKAGNVHVAVRARSRIANPDHDFASLLTAKVIEYVDRLSKDPQAARAASVRFVGLVTLFCDRRSYQLELPASSRVIREVRGADPLWEPLRDRPRFKELVSRGV